MPFLLTSWKVLQSEKLAFSVLPSPLPPRLWYTWKLSTHTPPPTALATENLVEVTKVLVTISEDLTAIKVIESLETVVLIHKPSPLLISKGNWCYVNSTLQTDVGGIQLLALRCIT